MSFTPSIPAAGQSLGNSRLQVQNNFTTLRTCISNVTQPNHIDILLTGAGKHIFVQMPVQTPGAANLPASGEGGMITQTVSGGSELFYARDGVSTRYQMTGPASIGASGYTPLYGGMILQWGLSPQGIIMFPKPFPNAVFNIQLTYNTNVTNNPAICATNVSTTQFTTVTNGTGNVYWMAIGN